VHLLGDPTVARILEHLPYHRRIKIADRDLIANRLRLGLCGIYAELERMIDPPALLSLLAHNQRRQTSLLTFGENGRANRIIRAPALTSSTLPRFKPSLGAGSCGASAR
jgi:hypothetical protein